MRKILTQFLFLVIVLHNSMASDSCAFVATCPTDGSVQIIDWYNAPTDVAAFEAVHSNLPISAFPTVLLDIPAYSFTHTDRQGNTVTINVPDSWGTLRQPANWIAAQEALNSSTPQDYAETIVPK